MEFVISPNTQNLLLVEETLYNFCSNPLFVILLFLLKFIFFFNSEYMEFSDPNFFLVSAALIYLFQSLDPPYVLYLAVIKGM